MQSFVIEENLRRLLVKHSPSREAPADCIPRLQLPIEVDRAGLRDRPRLGVVVVNVRPSCIALVDIPPASG